MIPENIDEILNSVSHEVIKGSPGGICSRFVALNNEIGVKLYRDERDRNACYERQTFFAKHKCAPETYGKVTLKNQENFKYGYLSEKVKVLKDALSPTMPPHPEFNGTDCNGLDKDYSSPNYYNNCRNKTKLLGKLRDAGFEYYDWGARNVGLKNGEFVCIDFGDESGEQYKNTLGYE